MTAASPGSAPRDVVITGGTGYIGRVVAASLVERGHRVRVVARPPSAGRVPAGATAVAGDALAEDSLRTLFRRGDTVVHLVGTPHPSPSKAGQFREVDLRSVLAAVGAAREAQIAHFVYVSVARPAPVMKAYQAVRAAGEKAIADARLTATVVRPWYVLGPGHRWPYVLVPVYALARWVPSMREGARRLGLVTLPQMASALVRAVEDPPSEGTTRIVEVPEILGRS